MAVRDDIEEIARIVVDCGFRLHRDLGPGLLESVYEVLMFELISQTGLQVARQVPIAISYNEIAIENAFRADLLVESCLLIELKSCEEFAPVHAKQVLTYLRLMNLPLGILMNFGQTTFKGGVRRLLNGYQGTFPGR